MPLTIQRKATVPHGMCRAVTTVDVTPQIDRASPSSSTGPGRPARRVVRDATLHWGASTMRSRAAELCVLAALLTIGGCCSEPYGRLGGAWVLVARAEGAAGIAKLPLDGQPLQVRAGCFPSAILDEHFGNQCHSHEGEGGGGDNVSGEVRLGNNPTEGEVRWYCTGRSVFRVVITRCPSTNTFQVTELAVTMQRE